MKPLSHTQTAAERWLTIFVRGIGVITLFAAIAVVLPSSAMAKLHELLGFAGELPDLPIVGYLTRSLSAFYVFFGCTFLYLGKDVRRYSELIRFISILGLLFAVVIIAICIAVKVPIWWTVGEGIYLIGYFGTTFLLSGRLVKASD